MNLIKIQTFLSNLSQNNSKPWMDENKKEYLAAKTEWLELIEIIIGYIYSIDPSIGFIESKSTIFRINRDVRFSHDKSPYNTHFSALIKRSGRKSQFAGYYLNLDKQGILSIGGGLMEPEPDTLKNIRVNLNKEGSAKFKKLFPLKSFKIWDHNKLKRIPNEFKDSLVPELMLYKTFVQMESIELPSITDPVEFIECEMKKLQPFILYLNELIVKL